MHQWQSALKSIRDCIGQLQAEPGGTLDHMPPVRLDLLGIREPYLEFVLITRSQLTGQEHLWISAGPNFFREDPVFLPVEMGTPEFVQIKTTVEQLARTGTPIISRELEVRPDGLDSISRLDGLAPAKRLEVRTLQAIGAPVHLPTCLPVAIIILRSAEAGRPIVLLKQRSRYADVDSFHRLSLLSAGLLEEDLAGALGVPAFPDLSAPAALDAMWKAYGKPDPLPIPLDAFVRAARRETLSCCGLDIAAERFLHRGCQLLDRSGRGHFVFFCVFELALYRHPAEDEMELAQEWHPERLVPVNEDSLYSPGSEQYLNMFLQECRVWLETEIFASPAVFSRPGSQQLGPLSPLERPSSG
jgi:hypothetical protein